MRLRRYDAASIPIEPIARKFPRMPLFGVLPVSKSKDVTSRRVVDQVERIVRPDRVGHTGTLDPLAEGVLLLAIGNATRIVEFSHECSKSYIATFELGKRSDTLDSTGDIQDFAGAVIPSTQEIEAELVRWVGQVEQVPPLHSAINVAGKRAYRLARKGVDFELPARTIQIHQLTLREYDYPRLQIEVNCGSGTYIRSLGRDIADGLRTSAIMVDLVRTRIGPFTLGDCIQDHAIVTRQQVIEYLHSPRLLLNDWPTVHGDAEQCIQIRHGIPLRLPESAHLQRAQLVDNVGNLVALLVHSGSGDLFRSLRVFQTTSDEIQPTNTKTRHTPES